MDNRCQLGIRMCNKLFLDLQHIVVDICRQDGGKSVGKLHSGRKAGQFCMDRHNSYQHMLYCLGIPDRFHILPLQLEDTVYRDHQ